MFNGETFTHYTEKEGLSNSIVQSIVEDNNSNIWIGTEKGLNQIVLSQDSVNGTNNNPVIHTFGQHDGLMELHHVVHLVVLMDLQLGLAISGHRIDRLSIRRGALDPSVPLHRLEKGVDGTGTGLGAHRLFDPLDDLVPRDIAFGDDLEHHELEVSLCHSIDIDMSVSIYNDCDRTPER